jgi:hypothetical protein
MKTIVTKFGYWYIEIIPEDGARISVLKYDGNDLLTAIQPSFKAPEKFLGDFETRPVYGYDDCFPSVDPCTFPDGKFKCRDHGELCWQKWKLTIDEDSLICSTDCIKPEVTFIRALGFSGNTITWRFEVKNRSSNKIPFLHVMHALMPLKNIQRTSLPEFNYVVDEVRSDELRAKNQGALVDSLLSIKPGIYKMLLLREIGDGSIELGFKNGLALHIDYDKKLFPTLGIWWNNGAYPGEAGLQRFECAFEPIPGTSSDLSKSFGDGVYLTANPGQTVSWEITWTIDS